MTVGPVKNTEGITYKMNFTDTINIYYRTEYKQGSNFWQSLAEIERNLTPCPLDILVLN